MRISLRRILSFIMFNSRPTTRSSSSSPPSSSTVSPSSTPPSSPHSSPPERPKPQKKPKKQVHFSQVQKIIPYTRLGETKPLRPLPPSSPGPSSSSPHIHKSAIKPPTQADLTIFHKNLWNMVTLAEKRLELSHTWMGYAGTRAAAAASSSSDSDDELGDGEERFYRGLYGSRDDEWLLDDVLRTEERMLRSISNRRSRFESDWSGLKVRFRVAKNEKRGKSRVGRRSRVS